MFKKFFKKGEEIPLPLRAIQALHDDKYEESLELFNEYIDSIEKLSWFGTGSLYGALGVQLSTRNDNIK